ncbi:hypothetical protein KBTX_01904 [wastewater metagenome]|uniref:EAL domain n=2 Tax=unclassified sequences TaxID=12908 RepID=A0A5B8RAF7_9ZZZZ|nr:hypothetical protein KBTEX_01904 [uncultured organism]
MPRVSSTLDLRQAVHDRIAEQAPLEQIFTAIVAMAEEALPGARVSIMRYDPDSNTLSLTGQSPFPQWCEAALNHLPVAPDTGTCGRAAYLRETVITRDIDTDPAWTGYRHVARQAGLQACWSVPILGDDGTLIGTFAVYYDRPRSPSRTARREIERAARLVALAMARHDDRRRHQATEQRHQSLFFHHPDGVCEFDLDGNFLHCNAAMEHITGFRRAGLVGRHFNEFVTPEYRALTERHFDLAARGVSQHYETSGMHPDGRQYPVEMTNLPIVVDGNVVGVYGICRDITERRARDEELRLLQRGIEASSNGVVMVDAQSPGLPMVYVNPAFTHITGYTRDEAIGHNCRFLQGADTDPADIERIRDALSTHRDVQITLRNYRKGGQAFWNRLSLTAVFDEQQRCTHFIGIQQDVTRERESRAQLAYQATHDRLTGLLTREALIQELSRLDHALLLHIDLDGFSQVNAGAGYEAGNRLLLSVSQRLGEIADVNAMIARLSGDGFAIAVPGRNSTRVGIRLIERLLDALATPFENITGHPLQISASIGAASTDYSGEDKEALLGNAEAAMREAKQIGRNTWQWYSAEVASPVRDYVVLRRELQQAIAEDQLELHYQPIVAADTGEVRSLEALVRWRHPERGLLGPGEFIPLAETTGQIVDIGTWVLRQACRDLAGQRRNGGLDVPVAVNLSPIQFRRTGFLDMVRTALADNGIEGEALEVEVTESVLLSGADQAIALLDELRAMGVRVAIDDFGTGYSSLSYLRDLPITKVKLDRGFIRDINESRGNAAIVEAVAHMARHLGIEVVAEGVETTAQHEALQRFGCGLLQGFLFSPPRPLEAIARGPRVLLPVAPS